MKDRIVFFVLGVVLATVAYFVGDMDKADAQSGTKVFEGNVLIKGQLTVNSGRAIIKYDPFNLDDPAKTLSSITFLSDTKGASILLTNGPQNRRGEKPSTVMLSATKHEEKGDDYAFISLTGRYGRDHHAVLSGMGLQRAR